MSFILVSTYTIPLLYRSVALKIWPQTTFINKFLLAQPQLIHSQVLVSAFGIQVAVNMVTEMG